MDRYQNADQAVNIATVQDLACLLGIWFALMRNFLAPWINCIEAVMAHIQHAYTVVVAIKYSPLKTSSPGLSPPKIITRPTSLRYG